MQGFAQGSCGYRQTSPLHIPTAVSYACKWQAQAGASASLSGTQPKDSGPGKGVETKADGTFD